MQRKTFERLKNSVGNNNKQEEKYIRREKTYGYRNDAQV